MMIWLVVTQATASKTACDLISLYSRTLSPWWNSLYGNLAIMHEPLRNLYPAPIQTDLAIRNFLQNLAITNETP